MREEIKLLCRGCASEIKDKEMVREVCGMCEACNVDTGHLWIVKVLIK